LVGNPGLEGIGFPSVREKPGRLRPGEEEGVEPLTCGTYLSASKRRGTGLPERKGRERRPLRGYGLAGPSWGAKERAFGPKVVEGEVFFSLFFLYILPYFLSFIPKSFSKPF